MALIECPACKRQVSTDARACPNCGARLKRGPWGAVLLVLGGLFAAFMGYGFYLNSLPGAAEARRARDAYKVCVDLAKRQAERSTACDRIVDEFQAKYGRRP